MPVSVPGARTPDVAEPHTNTHARPWRYAVILLTMVAGTLASVGTFVAIDGWRAHIAELRFTSLARDHLHTLNSGLTDTTDLLRSIRAYFESFDHPVTRTEYQAFSRSLRERVVGLRDTGWAPRVTAANRDAFEREIRASGWPDFQIVEFSPDHKMVRAKDRPEYFPVIYSDPGPANRYVMGFDFASEPVRNRTIARALAADAPFVTPPLKLVNLDRPIGGMMGFIPVTRTVTVKDTAGADIVSHPALGIVGGVFETAPMIENILATKLHRAGLDIYVFDPNGAGANRLIYWYSSVGKTAPAEASLLAVQHWQGTLELADQQWGVIFVPNDKFDAGNADWTAILALVGGLVMTASIAGYLGFSLRRTRQLERLTTSLSETTEELRRNGAKLDHLARHDALTGLPNRIAFRDDVSSGLRRVRRGQGLAVLYLDLDRFKAVNDTLGHAAGDRLLCDVADRMREVVRETDTITRLGGDEFAIAQYGVEQPRSGEMLARRLIDTLSNPYDIAGHRVVVGVSIGITLADRDDLDADQLLRRADMALYAAKRGGRGTWCWFEPTMDLEVQTRRGLEMDLRHGLDTNALELYYQPRVTVPGGDVRGFEALLRWHHPDRGLLLPGDFMQCAEETGLIVPIGAWVLRTALKQAADWPAGMRVAVNLSPYQFARGDLADMVEAALASAAQPGERLELEITENALLRHFAETQSALKRLSALGVAISMDDFGTGYASLSHLRSIPFDRIKIDQSFIGGMTETPEGGAIVRDILRLAASLGIAATAEGVETREQFEQLAFLGCDEAQGYLFSPPRPVGEVARLMAVVAGGDAPYPRFRPGCGGRRLRHQKPDCAMSRRARDGEKPQRCVLSPRNGHERPARTEPAARRTASVAVAGYRRR
jgi:diguanylate cyclase (GGDEF)-like protein